MVISLTIGLDSSVTISSFSWVIMSIIVVVVVVVVVDDDDESSCRIGVCKEDNEVVIVDNAFSFTISDSFFLMLLMAMIGEGMGVVVAAVDNNL